MRKRFSVLVLMVFCITGCFILNGCAQLGKGVLQMGANLLGKTIEDSGKKKVNRNFVPKSGTDTKETIVHELGQPDEIIVIDSSRQVLVYKSYGLLELYALKNQVYQTCRVGIPRKMDESRAKGTLKNDLVQIFPCFREDVYTPRKYFALAQITNGMGRAPDDSFLLKDEQGKAVPNSTIVWYFNINNNQLTRVLMISLRNNIATEVEEWTGPQAMSAYNSYVVLCQTMAARPPKFALR